MSSHCFDNSCSQGCCNYKGYCPQYSMYDSNYNSCYYYYSYSSTIVWSNEIIGYIAGGVLLAVIVSFLVYRHVMKKR